jgi:hypothetical protein
MHTEATRPQHYTATGDITAGPAVLYGFVLTPAAAVATAVIREGGSGGTIRMALQAAANGGSVVVAFAVPMTLIDPHVTLSGVGALFAALM